MMWIWGVFFFIFGICIGSFSNVLIYRIPKQESINFPASHCMSCQTTLKWYHNVPIFSWLFLGGKCAFCKEKISVQYPIIEFLAGILMFAAFWFEARNLDLLALARAFLLGICFIILLALSVIDLRTTYVPDSLLIASVLFAVLYAYCRLEFGWQPLIDGAIFAGAFFILRFLVTVVLRREAMGSGDIPIAAVIGIVLGWKVGIVAIWIGAILTLPAYLIANIAGKKDVELPFIPFLAAGLLLGFIFKTQILELLARYYG